MRKTDGVTRPVARRRSPRRPAGLFAVAAVGLLLTACSDPADDVLPPEKAITAAKTTLDETSGVTFAIVTDDLPADTLAMSEAEGTLTRAPAFDGSITVPIKGLSVSIDAVAVEGEIYAKLPFTTSFQTIDPESYGVPDPAGLLDPDTGISSLLAATEDLQAGDSIRGGADNRTILTEYSGVVPGDAVAGVLPGSEGEFEATYTISDDGVLSEAVFTGHFNGEDVGANTYTLTIEEYDVDKEITQP